MMNPVRKFCLIFAVSVISANVGGCVPVAMVPVMLNLAAEGATVAYTDKTITENLKDAINQSKKDKAQTVVQNNLAPLPPRKPALSNMKVRTLAKSNSLYVTAQPMTIIVSEN